VFAHLIEEYGSVDQDEPQAKPSRKRKGSVHSDDSDDSDDGDTKTVDSHSALIQAEERVTGKVTSATYLSYFRFAGSVLWVPAIIFLMILAQAASSGFCS
jgi:ATP-binding cassette subfamily C (CFTR/MRP) protein 1